LISGGNKAAGNQTEPGVVAFVCLFS